MEWLETNGLGGWAGSTSTGCNTRRYHGLLVAAIVPPTERKVLLSKLDETIVIGDERFELGVNDYGGIIHPKGDQYQTSFTRNIFPEFIYEAGGIKLKKTVAMIHGENTTIILYEVLDAGKEFILELLPLIANRGYHSLMHANDNIRWDDFFIKVPGAVFRPKPEWYFHFNYEVEKYRGLDFEEDLFSPGIYAVLLKKGDVLGVVVSTDNADDKDASELLRKEYLRRSLLLKNEPDNDLVKKLVLAADQFIVKRDEHLKTIIAGYHWFTDWGRDTMISLPGLCLATGRFEDAKKILAAFAKNVSMGMLPNRFQDNGDEPEYNNVDGTLWYFIAIYKYLQVTDDKDFVLQEILPVLKDIVDWHFKGTRYNIHVADDGLLYAGEKGQQLTWMDARIGDWVVTPRMGKPVEIQALWYNALKIFSELLRMNNQENDAYFVELSAEKAKENFTDLFWYATGNYLYDVVDENNIPVADLRPNQLFAISLPFPLVDGDKAEAVLKVVEEKLYTPVGLRSLSPDHPSYACDYGGDAYKRDACYHQGTVWSWLLGAYVDSLIKTSNKIKALKVIENFSYHLDEACVGNVSEIFDADPPHHPRGCVAQAWGVAEVLRVIKEYGLPPCPPKGGT